jgi:hypothetical protein
MNTTSIPTLFENLRLMRTDSEFKTALRDSVLMILLCRMIAFDKTFRSNPWFVRAVSSLCEIYALIHDDPSRREIKLCKLFPLSDKCPMTKGLLHTAAEEEAERKKAVKKAQKAGSKAKKGENIALVRRNND